MNTQNNSLAQVLAIRTYIRLIFAASKDNKDVLIICQWIYLTFCHNNTMPYRELIMDSFRECVNDLYDHIYSLAANNPDPCDNLFVSIPSVLLDLHSPQCLVDSGVDAKFYDAVNNYKDRIDVYECFRTKSIWNGNLFIIEIDTATLDDPHRRRICIKFDAIDTPTHIFRLGENPRMIGDDYERMRRQELFSGLIFLRLKGVVMEKYGSFFDRIYSVKPLTYLQM